VLFTYYFDPDRVAQAVCVSESLNLFLKALCDCVFAYRAHFATAAAAARDCDLVLCVINDKMNNCVAVCKINLGTVIARCMSAHLGAK
jgi:hypothetical protein